MNTIEEIVVSGWDQEMAELIGWFRTVELPIAPFCLAPGHTVVDVDRWRAAIALDIEAGPSSARAGHGGLRHDLRALRIALAAGAESAAEPDRRSRPAAPGPADLAADELRALRDWLLRGDTTDQRIAAVDQALREFRRAQAIGSAALRADAEAALLSLRRLLVI